MKLIITLTMLSVLLYSPVQQNAIKRRYKMEFEEKIKSQNSVITFEKEIYRRKLPDGKIVKGKIEYSDQTILVIDKETSLQMEFFEREMKNDTIYFKTKDLKEVESKNKKGVTPSKTETQVDHVVPKSKGGSGTPNNGQVLCRDCNIKKSNN
ncbi:HNH endonuclease [Flavobacterium ardleyense]|uniref:HNH endonuclease n=1 Tax=Flavobacterium ardleyense TaxID=2038737 RepID=UPI00298D1E23|nr:HNH endonuclease signature motif containing protein [Flavobacterium ardleyense]